MADKQISQLVAATTINNDDLFVMQQGGTAKKLSGQKLADFVYQSAADQIERVDEAVEQAQAAVDSLEEQKNEIAQTIASMAELGTDTTLTTPAMAADAAATGEVKDIALARFEQAEITGVTIATFDDGADNVPVEKLVVNIEPVQSGSGDPSPDNVRPITGWTGANVMRTGKNLYDYNECLNQTISNSGIISTSDNRLLSPLIRVKEGRQYIISFPSGTWFAGYAEYDADETWVQNNFSYNTSVATVFTPQSPYIRLYYRKADSSASMSISDLVGSQLEFGSRATAYEPYQGETYSITFPSEAGTVYGGTLDVTNGVLTVDRASTTVGTSGWSLYGTYIYKAFADKVITDIGDTVHPLKCSMLPYGGADYIRNFIDKHIYQANNRAIYIIDEDCSTADDYYDKYETATIVYYLATPVTYTLTPTEVKTLLAINTIWADTGNIDDLIYRKMPIPVEELENTFESMIAGVEETMEATQNYAVDNLVVAVHKLYHIDSNIASGETLDPGTNCHVTTVANELIALDDIISQQLSTLGNVANLTYQVVT